MKSNGELDSLVKNVILAPGFKTMHFKNFNAANEQAHMDNYIDAKSTITPNPFAFDDTWILKRMR